MVEDEKKTKEVMLLLDLTINSGKFNLKMINTHKECFNHLVSYMTAFIEGNFEVLQEKFMFVMELAEQSTQNGSLPESKYLNICRLFKFLSNESETLRGFLKQATPVSFVVDNENNIILTLQ